MKKLMPMLLGVAYSIIAASVVSYNNDSTANSRNILVVSWSVPFSGSSSITLRLQLLVDRSL